MNCHNIGEIPHSVPVWSWDFDLMKFSALDAEAAEDDGGAMNVRGSLMVMGTLSIRDCRTKKGKGGSLGSNYGSGYQKVDLCYRVDG